MFCRNVEVKQMMALFFVKHVVHPITLNTLMAVEKKMKYLIKQKVSYLRLTNMLLQKNLQQKKKLYL